MNDKEENKDIQEKIEENRDRDDKETSQLTEAIREQATEDEAPLSAGYTLRKILGGDFLTADVMRKLLKKPE